MIQNDLRQLVDLQEIDSVIDRLNAELRAIPLQIEAKKEDLNKALSRVGEEKAKLVTLQLKKKDKEMQAGSFDDAIKKNEMQLNTLKSNEAYKAMMLEIEASKRQKSSVEDEILNIMEEMDAAAKNIKAFEAQAKGDQQKIESEIRQCESEMAKLNDSLSAEQSRRANFTPNVRKEMLARYESLRKKKKGSVLSAVAGESCSVCNTQIPSSVINEIKKAKDMISCETCSSILYFADALSPAAPG